MASPRELLNAAKAEIREIEAAEVAARLDHYQLLDVREPDEYEQGAVPGAVHVPRGQLEFSRRGSPDGQVRAASRCTARVAFARPSPRRRSRISATRTWSRWSGDSTSGRTTGLAWSTPRTLSADQRNRYQRHLLLPEVGEAGQRGCSTRRCCSSAQAGSGPRRPSISRPPVWHPRHHRHGRRGRLEPPAPDPAQSRPHRRSQGRLGEKDADRDESRPRRHRPTTCV